MTNRLGAAFVAAASIATVVVVGTGTASAAQPCGTYPPGQGYSLARAPFSGTVKAGTTVGTRGTLRRGGQACVGFRLGLYTKPATQVGYRLAGSGLTDNTGSVRKPIKVTTTTRFFYNMNIGGGRNVRSGISQLIAR